jgi:mannose-6-phosphate isomerase-like protein (cupin superfamily)
MAQRYAAKLSYQNPEATAEGVLVYPLQESLAAPLNSARFTVEPGSSSPVDSHKVSEVWIVVEGAGELLHEGRSVRLDAGEAVSFAPWETHQLRNDGERTFVALAFWW